MNEKIKIKTTSFFFKLIRQFNIWPYLFFILSILFTQSAMAGWQAQWIDRFEGTGVNWDNWTAQIQANYNNEVQCYTDDDSSVDRNFEVSNGTLKIIARRQSINCPGLGGLSKDWTSGRLNSKDKREILYGRIESKIRFHNLESGTWPAFWMLENRISEEPVKNDNDFINWPNPGAGEIDVWEWFSNSPRTYITNFFNTNGCGNEVRYNYPNGGSDVLEWHKYAIEWDENAIKIFIDEHMVTSHNITNCTQYKEPMFLLLNVAIGGALGGSVDPSLNSATMEVDYIAHCTKTSDNDLLYCDESTVSSVEDDDNDGVSNDIDLCPGTEADVPVDENGCVITQPENQAPSLRIVTSQNNANLSTIDPEKGRVTIFAIVSDNDINDQHTFTWDVSKLPNPEVNNNIVIFDPSSLESRTYKVSVTVTDNGSPALSSSTTFSLNVVNAPPKKRRRSGGSLSILLLLLVYLGLWGGINCVKQNQ